MSKKAIGFSVETWIRCPYDKAHMVSKKDMWDHLGTCRRVYNQTLSAEGRQTTMGKCNHNCGLDVSKLELHLHKYIGCKEETTVFGQKSGKVTVQEADSSSEGSLLDEQEGLFNDKT